MVFAKPEISSGLHRGSRDSASGSQSSGYSAESEGVHSDDVIAYRENSLRTLATKINSFRSIPAFEAPPRLAQLTATTVSRVGGFSNPPALIEAGPLRFVITDSPTTYNLVNHVKELQKFNVKHVCRASEASYPVEPLQLSGIKVHEVGFNDGQPPPDDIILHFLRVVKDCFVDDDSIYLRRKFQTAATKQKGKSLWYGLSKLLRGGKRDKLYNPKKLLNGDERVSVHCVAGLGRSPLLVAIALVEFAGLAPDAAVELIRRHRRGAINPKQLEWLQNYELRYKQGGCSGCLRQTSRLFN